MQYSQFLSQLILFEIHYCKLICLQSSKSLRLYVFSHCIHLICLDWDRNFSRLLHTDKNTYTWWRHLYFLCFFILIFTNKGHIFLQKHVLYRCHIFQPPPNKKRCILINMKTAYLFNYKYQIVLARISFCSYLNQIQIWYNFAYVKDLVNGPLDWK